MTAILALLMVVQASLGLLLPGQYRDVAWIRSSWFGNDWVTLVVAVPILVGARALADRGSVRGRLMYFGAVGYAIYNGAFYLFGASINAFFPIYVATLVLAAVMLIGALSRLDAGGVSRAFPPTTPVRTLGGGFMLIGLGLASVWIGMWAAHVFAGRPTPVEPEAFKVVAALDLTLMVPALVGGGALLWRREPWGFIIAAIAGVQGTLYLLVLSVNSVVAIRQGLIPSPGELPVWGSLLAVMAAATAGLLASASFTSHVGRGARAAPGA